MGKTKGRLGAAVAGFQVDNRKIARQGEPGGKQGQQSGGQAAGKSGLTKAEEVAKAARKRQAAGKNKNKSKQKK